MKTVLLDSSGIIAYVDRRDQYHRRALPVLRGLLKRRVALATTSYIVSEVLTYAQGLGGLEAATRVMDFLLALSASNHLSLHHLTANEFMEAYQVFARGPEKSFSFPDATVVWLAARLGSRQVFGYDRDFVSHDLDLLG